MPYSVLGAPLSQDLNHRVLDAGDIQDNKYVLTGNSTPEDNSLHYFAEYKGAHDSFGNSNIIKNIEIIVSFHDKNTFRVKILDKNDQNRWQIPETAPFPHFASEKTISQEESSCKVEIEKEPFAIVITRKDTNEVLFNTKDQQFLFTDLYIRLSTTMPTDNVYGFGERYYKFKLSPGTYTIWGRDDPKILEDGTGGGNTYSQHPVGLFRGKDKNFYLTLMRNSNAMDIIIDDKPSLTYKMVGGVIDLVFFVGDKTPDNVLKSYHNYLGNFTMMPFWSMGFHQSKWGYTSHSIMNDVVQNYDRHDIPLDVIWSDIDYMIDKEIFTVDTYNFPPEQMKELTTKYKKKWVPIIDPGVRIVNARGPGKNEGEKRDVFLKSHTGQLLSGYVWPGRVYFPDLFHENTEQWWADMLEVLHKIIPFAGIWLDMNEVANFVNGEEHRYDSNRYDQIPYTPGKNHLNTKTISLDAKHANGVDEYNVHGLFSLLQTQITHKFLQTKSKLPFILTRGTSMGVGKYSAHWTGDNGASWDFLRHSIAGNFNFQIFGIPFVGADICGFMDDTNEELCARWTQLGALYPFARNHHEERTRNQEPWTFTGLNTGGISVLETTKIALKTRYALLKWYYSLFIETGGAGSVFRPLVFEFPDDQVLYNDGFVDWEFLLGKGVLCTPKVEPGEPFVTAHFPNATWFDLFKGRRFITQDATERTLRVETPYDAPVPMFLRAGHIVHMQKVDHVLSTEDLNNDFELIVALEEKPGSELLTAEGFIMGISSFDDNSVHDKCMEDNCLYNINVSFDKNDKEVKVSFKKQKENVKLDSFGLYGLRLYGTSLDFMEEDENKVADAIVTITGQGKTDFDQQFMAEAVTSPETNAFVITFKETLNIQDGDELKIEFII